MRYLGEILMTSAAAIELILAARAHGIFEALYASTALILVGIAMILGELAKWRRL